MAGATRTTGYAGPPPNPNARRRNKRDIDPIVIDADEETVTESGNTSELPDVVVPEPDEDWHPIARKLWDGVAGSVVARLYEPSDWALAYILCEDYSRELKPRKVQVGLNGMGEPILVEMDLPMPGAKLNSLLKGLNSLIATEGDRRRLQIEVKRKSHVQHGADSKTAKELVTQDRLTLLNGGKTG